MKNKIESVRVYTILNKKNNQTRYEYDVLYNSGRARYYYGYDNLPLTVAKFIVKAKEWSHYNKDDNEYRTITKITFKEG